MCDGSAHSSGCVVYGSNAFADDIVLLARCASALRKMLSICSSYAASHGLMIFNTDKTHDQLICFRKSANDLQ